MPNSKLKLAGAAGLASVLALSLSACREDQRQAALPLPPTTAFALAPAAMELPYAPPAPLGRLVADEGAYAWAERAYAMDEAFYDAPPDYGFYYDDVQPWVWETEDDWRMYAEPIDDGYRFYYYEPEAAYPYFIRDGRYGYGFDDAGRLVTLYDVAGQLLSTALLGEHAPIAGRYLAHSLLLARAADREQHIIVQEPLWTARAPILVRAQEPWIAAAWTAEPWVEYRTRYEQREIKRLVKDEKKRERIFERQREAPRGWGPGGARQVAQLEPWRDRSQDRGLREDRMSLPANAELKGEERGRERQSAKQERRDHPADARSERGPERQAKRAEPQRQKQEERGPDRQFAREEKRGPEARPAEQHGRMASAQEPRGGENRGGGGDKGPKAASGDHGGGEHRGGGDKGPKGGGENRGGGDQGGGDRGGKGGGKDR